MFDICSSLISLPDISKWNTSNVTNMSFMFNNCYSLISFSDISNLGLTNKTPIEVFVNCLNVVKLPNMPEIRIIDSNDI